MGDGGLVGTRSGRGRSAPVRGAMCGIRSICDRVSHWLCEECRRFNHEEVCLRRRCSRRRVWKGCGLGPGGKNEVRGGSSSPRRGGGLRKRTFSVRRPDASDVTVVIWNCQYMVMSSVCLRPQDPH